MIDVENVFHHVSRLVLIHLSLIHQLVVDLGRKECPQIFSQLS
jgi:hypothetical protein